MAKKKKERTEALVAQLIRHELEAQLSKLVRKAKRKVNRESGKLNDMLRLEYHGGEGFGFTEAEIIDEPHTMEEVEEVKKTEDSPEGEEQQ